jgi:hypothetical protein
MEKPEPAPNPPTPGVKGLTTKRIVLILGALAIVCAALVAAYALTRPPMSANIGEGITPLGNLVVDESNLEDIQREIEEKVARGMFETHMTTTWTFPNGNSPSTDAVMGNSANNNYPFWFELSLEDTGESVYTSSLLPLGTTLKTITLSKDLDAGTYPAVISIHMVDENNEPVESNMGFGVTLVIQN